MDKLVLKPVCSGKLDTRGEIDLDLVLAHYNFSFWYNGRKGYVIIDEYGPLIAEIDTGNYEYIIWGTETSLCRKSLPKLIEILGLREDLSEFHARARNDPLIGPFVTRYPGWRLRTTSVWWATVIGVCQQNASFQQGWRMLYNIIKLYGRKASVRGGDVPLPPTPHDILARPSLLVDARTGYRAGTILNIARWLTGACDRVPATNNNVTMEELLGIKGVGPYTARLSLVLSRRKYDQPPIDRWVKRIVAEAYNVSPDDVEEELVERYGEWAGLAVLVLTIALDAEPLRRALERIRMGRVLPEDTVYPTPLSLYRYL